MSASSYVMALFKLHIVVHALFPEANNAGGKKTRLENGVTPRFAPINSAAN